MKVLTPIVSILITALLSGCVARVGEQALIRPTPAERLSSRTALQGKGDLEVMRTLDEPVLIVVGRNEKTTRPAMSSQLYAAANVDDRSKELLIVPDAGHNDAAWGKDYQEAFAWLLNKMRHQPLA